MRLCGQQAVWNYEEENGLLTIQGVGAMEDYTDPEQVPWNTFIQKIKTVVIRDGITTVGDYAFAGGSNLQEVSLPGSVEIVGVFSFKGCTVLKEIVIPEGVRVLASKAFQFCSALRKVYLPSTLIDVDMRAFGKCESLEEVFYQGSEEQWEQIMISRSASDNQYLVQAKRHCLERQSAKPSEERPEAPDRYEQIILKIREVLDQGGDGKFYILAPKLWEPGIRAKSGDATLLVFPDGQTMLIDAGFVECGKHVVSLLRDLHLTSLDGVVLSHSHDDHAGGALAVAQYLYEHGGGIDACYRSSYIASSKQEPLFEEYLKQKGTHVYENVLAGYQWTVGDVRITAYHPTTEDLEKCVGNDESVNNVSILMKFVYGRSKYLTGGDLYIEMEEKLAEQYGDLLKADVMKSKVAANSTAECHYHGCGGYWKCTFGRVCCRAWNQILQRRDTGTHFTANEQNRI